MIRPAASEASGRICQPIIRGSAGGVNVGLGLPHLLPNSEGPVPRSGELYLSEYQRRFCVASPLGRSLAHERPADASAVNEDWRTGSDLDTPTGGPATYPSR